MAERDDDGKVGAFLLGFLLGVLVCLGAGGGYYLYERNRQAALAEESYLQALRAVDEAFTAQAEAEAVAARRSEDARKRFQEAAREFAKVAAEDKDKSKE